MFIWVLRFHCSWVYVGILKTARDQLPESKVLEMIKMQFMYNTVVIYTNE